MLDELSNLIKPEYRLAHMKNLLISVSEVLDMADPCYLVNKENRNDAIDYICDLLESQKTTPKEMQ